MHVHYHRHEIVQEIIGPAMAGPTAPTLLALLFVQSTKTSEHQLELLSEVGNI